MSTAITNDQRAEMIANVVRKIYPEARPIDVKKRTPLGTKIREAMAEAAREFYQQTGDEGWLKFAKQFHGGYDEAMDGKPAVIRSTK